MNTAERKTAIMNTAERKGIAVIFNYYIQATYLWWSHQCGSFILEIDDNSQCNTSWFQKLCIAEVM